MNKQHKYIKELHPYKITPPSETNNRWQTYVKDTQSNVRKQIIGKSEEDILNKLMVYYDVTMHIDNMSFYDIYNEWIEYKSSTVSSHNTIIRYNQRYNKYLRDSKLHNMRFKRIDLLTLIEECNKIVKIWCLTNKEWKNVKGIFNGMYDYAFCKGYIPVNLFDKVTISVKYRQINKKPSKEVIFTKAERESLYSFLENEYNNTHNIVCKAIQFQFLTGLRVGELEALKWENIGLNRIHIVCEQVQDRNSYKYSIVPHTKTNQDRYVLLVQEAKDLLNSIPRSSEYVFIKDGKPITTRAYNYILEKYAKYSGSVRKSSHDIRRSYASYLHGSYINPEIIREQLGHKDLRTTYSYIYNNLEDNEIVSGLEKALK